MQRFTIYLFIFVRRFTCLGRDFRPSSGAQNCTYSVRHLSDQYWYLPLARLAAGSKQDQDVPEGPDPARKLSANLYDIYHCCVYSEKLLMMDRGTALE